MTVLPDLLPELPEFFTAKLLKVELLGMTAINPSNLPKLGNITEAMVTIAANDDANGVFRIYSKDPRAVDNGKTVLVEEKDNLAVELIVQRDGNVY